MSELGRPPVAAGNDSCDDVVPFAEAPTLFRLKSCSVRRVNKGLEKVPEDLQEDIGLGLVNAVTDLDLSQNAITQLCPGFGVSMLANLTQLSLSHNRLTSLPDTFGELRFLKRLALDGNSLRELPASFASLQSLTQLYLGSNKLGASSSPPSAETWPFIVLGQLTELWLESNEITALPQDFGDRLYSLVEIDLARNRLHALPDSICRLDQLSILGLDRNRLTALPERLCDLRNLQQLYLYNNRIAAFPASLASFLARLDILKLHRNPLATEPFVFIAADEDLRPARKSDCAEDAAGPAAAATAAAASPRHVAAELEFSVSADGDDDLPTAGAAAATVTAATTAVAAAAAVTEPADAGTGADVAAARLTCSTAEAGLVSLMPRRFDAPSTGGRGRWSPLSLFELAARAALQKRCDEEGVGNDDDDDDAAATATATAAAAATEAPDANASGQGAAGTHNRVGDGISARLSRLYSQSY